DDALAEGAYDAISVGVAADHAWRSALDAEIAGYRAADDEYFRGRAADLVDIRNRVLAHLGGADAVATIAAGSIVAGDDISPSVFLAADWTRGGAIALAAGSPSSHVAMLARARGAPMVVGLGPLEWNGRPPTLALVDGDTGRVLFDPGPEPRNLLDQRMAAANIARAAAEAGRFEPALTADGCRITVLINVAAPEDLAGLDPRICDGIGLVRTEFLFEASRGLPDEETQYAAYRRILEWAGQKPVTIRTLDAGGQQADPWFDSRRREQSVPWPSRHPPLARAAGRVPCAVACIVACGSARLVEGHAADGGDPHRIRSRCGDARCRVR